MDAHVDELLPPCRERKGFLARRSSKVLFLYFLTLVLATTLRLVQMASPISDVPGTQRDYLRLLTSIRGQGTDEVSFSTNTLASRHRAFLTQHTMAQRAGTWQKSRAARNTRRWRVR